jgi:hypothetical protein
MCVLLKGLDKTTKFLTQLTLSIYRSILDNVMSVLYHSNVCACVCTSARRHFIKTLSRNQREMRRSVNHYHAVECF